MDIVSRIDWDEDVRFDGTGKGKEPLKFQNDGWNWEVVLNWNGNKRSFAIWDITDEKHLR